jgi:hypothetical protein
MIWLIIPLDFVLIPLLEQNISKAENELTPYSVDVSSYERSDGTFVESYTRRPPGSVEHDKPYERQISELTWSIYFLIIVGIVSLIAFLLLTVNEILHKRENYLRYVEIELTTKVLIDLSHLKSKPKYLINRNISRYNSNKTYRCRTCKRNIRWDEFHASSLAVRNPTKVCIDCMSLDDTVYWEGLKYASQFQDSMVNFISEFEYLNRTNYPDGLIEINQMKKIFYQKVKDIRV